MTRSSHPGAGQAGRSIPLKMVGAPLVIREGEGYVGANHAPPSHGGWPLPAAFFVLADRAPPLSTLEDRIAELVSPQLAAMGYALVRVAITPGRVVSVQIMAEPADGTPMRVSDCEAISHTLGAVLDVADPLPGSWTLEVSSPGIDRPLVRAADWNRFSGHLARVELAEPIAGRKRVRGTVLGADAEVARLRLADGAELAIPLGLIRRARLVLTEALIRATEPERTSN